MGTAQFISASLLIIASVLQDGVHSAGKALEAPGYSHRYGDCARNNINHMKTTLDTCRRECDKLPKCKSFVYVNRGQNSFCWLKRSDCPSLTSTENTNYHFFNKKPDKDVGNKDECSPGFRYDEKTKNCCDRCPDYQERWDGTKCVIRCIASKKWDGEKCVSRCVPPLKYNVMFGKCEAKTCQCLIWGDPHYRQFVRKDRIDFMGLCKYTFTKLKDQHKGEKCYFNIEQKNVHLGNPEVSYVNLVDVTVEDVTFRYNGQDKTVFIDGIDHTKGKFPMSVKTKKGTELTLTYRNRQFKLDASACGMVTSFRSYRLQTYISSSIGDKVEGICGTCNGKSNDDLVTRGGKTAASVRLFAESWAVPDDSGIQKQGSCKTTADVDGKCTADWAKKVKDRNHCGHITDKNGPFKACIASGLVDVKQYQGSCEFDVCFFSKQTTAATDVPEVVCKNLAAFADACAKQGVGAKWRTSKMCPMKCEANADFLAKMYPTCEKTCQQRTVSEDCQKGEPEDGCMCKNGYLRLGNECVQPEKCGCEAVDGQHIDIGQSAVIAGCTGKLECTTDGKLKKVHHPSCHRDATCAAANGLYACKCIDGFEGNGHACKTKCLKMDEKWDIKLSKCVLYCADKATTWDGKSCVPRCPDVQTKWNGKMCELRCLRPETQWSTVQAVCIHRCPDETTRWDKDRKKCVDRCEGGLQWDATAKKCTNRCSAADKWDERKKECKSRCPVYQKFMTEKCIDRCKQGEKWHEPTKKCYQDPIHPITEGGNGNGTSCSIPFLYGGKWREDCVGDKRKWCGTTENFDADGIWGYCPDKSNTTGGNGDGDECSYPFFYKGSYHGACLTTSARAWCGTVKDGSKWGYCPTYCEDEAGMKRKVGESWRRSDDMKVFCDETTQIVIIPEEHVTTEKGEKCVFPYKYKNRYFGICTEGKPWCATVADYDTNTDKWGYCAVKCTTQLDEELVAGESWSYEGTFFYCSGEGTIKPIPDPDVVTEKGEKCVFPFKYRSRYYGECIDGKPWCAVTRDYDNDKQWSHCGTPTTQPPKPSKRPTMSPTPAPTKAHTKKPTSVPTKHPTKAPTKPPTTAPTKPPTKAPTRTPTTSASQPPTRRPTTSVLPPLTRKPTPPPIRRPRCKICHNLVESLISYFNEFTVSMTEWISKFRKSGQCDATCKTQDKTTVNVGDTWLHRATEFACGKDGKIRKSVKTSKGNCWFPFTHKGTKHEKCIEEGQPWCFVDFEETVRGYCLKQPLVVD